MSGDNREFYQNKINNIEAQIAKRQEEVAKLQEAYNEARIARDAVVARKKSKEEVLMAVNKVGYAKESLEKAEAALKKLDQKEEGYRKDLRALDTPQRTVTKLEARIPQGGKYVRLRRQVYAFGGELCAHDEQITYRGTGNGAQITDDLHVVLYFPDEDWARRCRQSLTKYCNEHNIPLLGPTIEAAPDHSLNKSTSLAQYDAKYSPERTLALTEPSSSTAATTVLGDYRLNNEYLLSKEGISKAGGIAEKCHLIPKFVCKGDARNRDYCNFILLPTPLHKLFDNSAELAFYGKDPPSKYERAPKEFRTREKRSRNPPQEMPVHEVTLVAHFKTPELASFWGSVLRTTQNPDVGGCTLEVTILHPFPREFLEYVEIRHKVQAREMQLDGYDSDAGYSSDVTFEAEDEDEEEEEDDEEEEEVMHTEGEKTGVEEDEEMRAEGEETSVEGDEEMPSVNTGTTTSTENEAF